ncbi:MAG: hypothetical protein COV36_04970 [Alphaproteobacteria bacterium CG11_big_fil_rev_8_21_14_0_20_44_7]|nr:MAG: hypothetical protein COV36_04970 [Alphaproteobacteria bacterium CG11_big_fil_rev_8_21_14_0_20_44_7]
MKGSDLIQIGTAVYGLKWFDSLCQELGIEDKELSKLTEADSLPGPIAYAMRDIATKYMARVESMQINNKFQDEIMAGKVESTEHAAFMSGVIKGMALVLAAIHGEPDELNALAKTEDIAAMVDSYLRVTN